MPCTIRRTSRRPALEPVRFPLTDGGSGTGQYIKPERFPDVFAADTTSSSSVRNTLVSDPSVVTAFTMIVRQERHDDEARARAVVVAAFDRLDGVEPPEARLLDELRACDGWIPALSLVAVIDGQIVGHAVCTRGSVATLPCLGLGPIAVAPAAQRSGIGSALVHTMLGIATGMGEPLVALLGSPEYYSRFGFRPSQESGIEPPDPSWGGYFQVRTLSEAGERASGVFEYSAPFHAL